MRRTRASAAREEEPELLDESEQCALVELFEHQARAQAVLWRVRTVTRASSRVALRRAAVPRQRCFAGVGTSLAAVLAWAATWQALHPWQVVFHADFYGTLRTGTVCVADAAAAGAIAAASHALLSSRPRQLRVALVLALAVSLFWGVAWTRRVPVTRPRGLPPRTHALTAPRPPNAGCTVGASQQAPRATRSSCCGYRSRRCMPFCAHTWTGACARRQRAWTRCGARSTRTRRCDQRRGTTRRIA